MGALSHSQAKRGTHNDRSVIVAMDLVPSLLSVAGVSADGDVKFDGENVASTLIGKSDASRVAPIYWRRPPDRKNSPPALSEPHQISPYAMGVGNCCAITTVPMQNYTTSSRIRPSRPFGIEADGMGAAFDQGCKGLESIDATGSWH